MDFRLPDSGWTVNLVIAGFIISVGVAVPAGFQGSVINAPAEYIQQWCQDVILQRFHVLLSESEINVLWASVVTITTFMGLVGSFCGGAIATKYGRKKSFLICGIILSIAAPCFEFCRVCSSIELLFVGRAAAGLSLGLTVTVLPLYLTEISPPKLRGAIGVLLPVGLTAGVVLGQVVTLEQVLGTAELWHHGLSCYVLLCLVCFVPYPWLPESPEYLHNVKNEPEGARREICKLFGNKFAEDMKTENPQPIVQNLEISTSHSVWFVLREPELRLPLILLCAMTAGCGLSGINAIFSYSVSTLERNGLNSNDAKLVSLGMGCLNLAASCCGPFLMARFNRRPLMLISCVGCGVTLLLITMTITFIDSVNWFAEASIGMMLLFLLSYQTGIGQIPFFIAAELFRLESRPSAQTLGSLCVWISNLLISMLFPIEQLYWGAFAFLPCSISCLLLGTLVRFYLPETRDQKVSDIALLVSKGFKSKILSTI